MKQKELEALHVSSLLYAAEDRLKSALKTMRKEPPTPASLKRLLMVLAAYVRKKNERDEYALREISQRLKWLEAMTLLGDSGVGRGPAGRPPLTDVPGGEEPRGGGGKQKT